MPATSRAINERNAIEAATFAVQFAQPLESGTLSRIGEVFNTVAEELPGTVNVQQGLTIKINAGQSPSVTPMYNGVNRFVARPDGTHQWRVQVLGNFVQVACHDYTDFDEVWPRARRYLSLALRQLGDDVSIIEIGYQVIDKFMHTPGLTEAEYDMSELFRRDTPYLTERAWNSGLYWHVFQGWFDVGPEGMPVLNQVNVSNTELVAGLQAASIIDHRSAARPPGAQTVGINALLATEEGQPSLMDRMYSDLHARNVQIVRELLTDAKLRSIGLEIRT